MGTMNQEVVGIGWVGVVMMVVVPMEYVLVRVEGQSSES